MASVDVVIVAALLEEYAAARAVGAALAAPAGGGWQPFDQDTTNPYETITIPGNSGPLVVALARPTRMGGRSIAPIATALAGKLSPQCLAMSGVCAGNPGVVGLGDVVVAELTYGYGEGKRTATGFQGDHRQIAQDDRWIRVAQEFTPVGLPSYGQPTRDEATFWLLERLLAGDEPRTHPARGRYFPDQTWPTWTASMQDDGLIVWGTKGWALTDEGTSLVERRMYDDVSGPAKLPFAVTVAPMASGDVVVKDGLTWDQLSLLGVRTVAALEMEAATLATVASNQQVPHWLVAKGVMDHADPRKDDRFKAFAAHASAEVLFALIARLLSPRHANRRPTSSDGAATASNTTAPRVPIEARLDHLVSRDPLPVDEHSNGHLYLVVSPRTAEDDALGAVCTPAAATELNAALQRAVATRPRTDDGFAPDFRAANWRRDSTGIRSTAGIYDVGDVRESSLLVLTVCEDGTVLTLCGRATDHAQTPWRRVGSNESPPTRPVMFPRLLLGLIHSTLTFAADLAQRHMDYSGSWDIGLRLVGIKDAIAYDHMQNGNDDTVEPYDADTFERTAVVHTDALTNDTAAVTERLIAPLLRALTVDRRYLPYNAA